MKGVTLNQFYNILFFIAITREADTILNQSPIYILEKYERYIGDPSKVKDDDYYLTGIHPILKKALMEDYTQKWELEINTLKRNTKIKSVVD